MRIGNLGGRIKFTILCSSVGSGLMDTVAEQPRPL